MPPDRRTLNIVALTLLGALFCALYLWIGTRLEAKGTLRDDAFFHSDIGRVIEDLTVFHGRHKRSNVHPTFVLMLNPIGVGLNAAAGTTVVRMAVLMTSAIGGLVVALTGLFLLRAGLPLGRSLLFAAILGASATHLFFGSAPETWIWSALSLVLLFLCLQRRPGDWRWFIPAGLFSVGILITNLAFASLTWAASLLPWRPFWRKVRDVALYTVAVFALMTALVLVQKAIWPKSTVFYAPADYKGESRFIKTPTEAGRFSRRETLLFQHVFAFDWFAPGTTQKPGTDGSPNLRMEANSLSALKGAGKTGLVLWLALLVAATGALAWQRQWKSPVVVGLALCLAFNLALHSVYGDDLFLYGCNTVFLLVSWAALGTAQLPLRGRLAPLALDLVLVGVLACEAFHNASFVRELIAFTTTAG